MIAEFRKLSQKISQSTFNTLMKINYKQDESQKKFNLYQFAKISFYDNTQIIIQYLIGSLRQYLVDFLKQKQHSKNTLSPFEYILKKPNGKQIIQAAQKLKQKDHQIYVLIYLIKQVNPKHIQQYLNNRQHIIKFNIQSNSFSKIELKIEDWSDLISRLLPYQQHNKTNISKVFDFIKQVSQLQGYDDNRQHIKQFSLSALSFIIISLVVINKFPKKQDVKINQKASTLLNPQQPIQNKISKFDFSYRFKQSQLNRLQDQ